MSEHCEHCQSDTLVQYDGWDHHCFIDGAGYVHWDHGNCPFCAEAKRERTAIVAWLRADGGDVCNAYADEIERGEHLRGDDE